MTTPLASDKELGSLKDTTHGILMGWKEGTAGPINPDTNQMLTNVYKGVMGAISTVEQHHGRANIAANDLRAHPDWRQAESARLHAEGQREATEQLDQASVNLTVARAQLAEDARPTVERSEMLTARQDIQMALAGKGDWKAKVTELAKDDGSIGALASDPKFLKLLAMQRGLDEGETSALIERCRYAMLGAAADSADPARATAAQLWAKSNKLEGAIAGGHSFRRNAAPQKQRR